MADSVQYEKRVYGVATTIQFPLIDRGTEDFETTPVSHAAGDTQISKDEGAFANTTNAFAHEGNGVYSLALTATEMQAARISVTIVDQGTKEWEDRLIVIETYKDTAAQHEVQGFSKHTFHVAKSGNDNNKGYSFDDAKLTINGAITAASSGDTIIIHPGDYTESLDLLTAGKQLTFRGTDKHGCKISQTGGNDPVPTTYDGCKFFDLTLEVTSGNGRCLHISAGTNDIELHNCICINYEGDMVIDASAGERHLFRDCYMFGTYDVIFLGVETLIENCTLVTDGTFTGSGSARVLRQCAGADSLVIVKDSFLYAQPSYRKQAAKSPPLYESDRDLYGFMGTDSDQCFAIFENTIFVIDGYKRANTHASAYCSGDAKCISLIPNIILNNCWLFARTDQNQSTTDGWGIYDSNAQLLNCQVDISATDVAKDFDAASAKTIHLNNTVYDVSQIGSNVTVYDKGIKMDGSGFVDPGGLADEPAEVLMQIWRRHFKKSVVDGSAGTLKTYKDDDTNVETTQTISEAAGVQTLGSAS